MELCINIRVYPYMNHQQIEPQSNYEKFRHECEVRQCIKQGRDWFDNYIRAVSKYRGKKAAERLYSDVRDQAKKGNKGEAGTWL